MKACLPSRFARVSYVETVTKTTQLKPSPSTNLSPRSLRSPRSRKLRLLLALLAALTGGAKLPAQVSSDLEQGLKPYGAYHGGSLDNVSLSNGNLFFHADVLSYSQRGGELAYPIALQYNNENYSKFVGPAGCSQSSGVPCQTYMIFSADPNDPSTSFGAGVSIAFEGPLGAALSSVNTGLSLNGSPISANVNSVLTPDGSLHQLVTTDNGQAMTDGSGFYIDPNGTVVRDRKGSKFTAVNFPPSGSIEDANGNQLIASSSGWKDTLGRPIPLMPGPVHPADTPAASTANLSACPALNYANQPVSYAYTWSLPTVNLGTLALTLCYASVWVHSNFFNGLGNGPKEFDVNQNFTMLQSVVFPDGTYWAFSYDAAIPNNSSSYGYGDLLQITLPTGGSISYTWASMTGCMNLAPAINRVVETRTVNADDGSGGHSWIYNYGGFAVVNNNPTQAVTVSDPLGDDTVHTITGLGGTCSLYETGVQSFQGSRNGGTLLKTVATDYQYVLNPYDSNAISSNNPNNAKTLTSVFPVRVTTTLPNGMVRKVETDYDTALAYHGPLDGISFNQQQCTPDGEGGQRCTYSTPTQMPATNYTGSYGKVIATREFDWGQEAPGGLLRETFATYQWQSNSGYLTPNNLLDLAATTTVCSPLVSGETADGTGCTDPSYTLKRRAQTTYSYDEYSLNPSGVGTQFNSSPVNGNVRGNQTSVHHWLNGGAAFTTNCPISVSNGFLVSYALYNDTGTVNKTTDTCGTSAGDPNHTTSFAYSSAFAGAYATSATNPLGQTASTNYDFNTGEVVTQTDVNNQITTTGYDPKWRVTQVIRPDQGQTTFCYTDAGGSTCNQSAAPFKVVVTKKIDSTRNKVATAVVDGLGRKTETQLNSDPVCTSKVDTGYDAVGNAITVTNPFCSTSDSTYGVTTTAYDALRRITQVTHQDNSSATTTYTRRAVQFSDEGNGTRPVERISQSDGLGRLASVCEVSSTTLSVGSGATPAACNLDIPATGFLTTYSYDALGNLTGVSQGGYMPRSFTYDSLSHLLTAANPESGNISYTYDAAGNVITRTDARGIVTTYAYDKVHRLLSKSYSDNTPAATFVYDACPSGGCPNGVSPQLTVGRMVESSVPNAQTFYSYDSMGRVFNQWQCIPVSCGSTHFYALNYGYDLAGDITSSSNGVGVTLTSAYDTAARFTGVISNVSDANHPANLLSNIQYIAPGLPKLEMQGNGVTEALGYDTRLRLTSLASTSPTAVGATPGTGWFIVSGSEGVHQVTAATAQGSVTITAPNGQDDYIVTCVRNNCNTVWDTGKVFITINGHEYDYFFSGSNSSGNPDDPHSVAAGLVAAIQADGARVVNASCSDGPCSNPVITLTAVSTGSWGNLPFTTGYTYQSGNPNFAAQGPSFTASPASGSLSGGVTGSTTYDAGTMTVSVNQHPDAYSWSGSATTAASIAQGLCNAINNDSAAFVYASTNGTPQQCPPGSTTTTVTLVARTAGAATNSYALSVSSSSSAGFSPPSFSGNASGSILTGGNGATAGTVYTVSVGYTPNGDVLSANDSVNGNWTYGYDDFNRLISSNKNSGQQTYSYVHDRFGNRWQQNAPQGGSVFLGSFNGGNNRLDAASHDAAGNMTHDPITGANYAFDAEDRITQVNGGSVIYTYDADGHRVEKNVGGIKTDYVYDLAGHAVAEISSLGVVNREELFAGSKHLGTYVNGTTYFSDGDWLGTERVCSDMTGAVCETVQSLPYGDGQTTTGTCGDPSTRHFTGKERDTETGLDYFGARYYSNGMGRFITPDWAAKPISVPYADFGDPQSLNLYGYVRGRPTMRFDSDGHQSSAATGTGWLCLDCPRAGFEIITNPKQAAKDAIQAVAAVVTSVLNLLPVGDNKPNPNYVPPPSNIPVPDSGVGHLVAGGTALAMVALVPEGEVGAVVDMTATVRAPSVIRNFVFRGDPAPMDVVFDVGIQAKGASTDLLAHALDSDNPASGFVATSKSPAEAAVFSDQIYVIRPVDGIDVNETLGQFSPFSREQEIAIPGPVSPVDVRAVTLPNEGVSLLNPNYRP
jgi:RHS repeat-associated protein